MVSHNVPRMRRLGPDAASDGGPGLLFLGEDKTGCGLVVLFGYVAVNGGRAAHVVVPRHIYEQD